jgi:tetratricopeptide (TPR) repeat protein
MLNDMDQAIGFFNQQIELNPYSTAAWFNLGLAYFQQDLFEKTSAQVNLTKKSKVSAA